MDWRRGLTFLVVAHCLVLAVQGVFVIEKGGLKIKLPVAAKAAHPNGFDVSLANFGTPLYGGQLQGELIYVDKDHGIDATCSKAPCKYACQDFAEATPKFDLNDQAANPDKKTYIMLVDRGPEEAGMSPCKFAEKVWNAQRAGAKGVVVVNYEDKHTTMEAPDDEEDSYKYLRNITIPAAFITKSDGDALKALLVTGSAPVLVSMDWTDALPRQSQVKWEFWTNSNDMCGPVCDVQKEFIKEFVPMAKQLESGNWTHFTPHYIVWICPQPYRDSNECRSQCINQGRYCTPDPDGDLNDGYSGKDIVQENLRQLCVFQLSSKANMSWVWWDYVTRFGEQCKMSDKKYNQDCAESVFKQLKGETWSSLQQLRDCIGDPKANTQSPIMEAEMKSQRGGGDVGEVYILPTIRINSGQYRGKLSYSEVLRALCAGFDKGKEPAPCAQVSVDECGPGTPGYAACSKNTDGKTRCHNTFSGYTCSCGSGFMSHKDDTGKETCLNINECLSTHVSQLDPDCSCARCACQDTYGDYKCIKDLPDMCAKDNGGCWQGDVKVNGQDKHFTACQDNLEDYKANAAKGWTNTTEVPLHMCTCPTCFTEFITADGSHSCVPKCDLDYCDLDRGYCTEPPSSGGLSTWAVVGIVIAALWTMALTGYAVYKFRLRNAMHQEIRAIMAQYMPLENQEGATNTAPPTNGIGTV